MFCPNCGKEIEDGAKFCGECGAAIEASAAEVVPSSEALNSESASREEAELTFRKKRFSNWTMTINEIVTVVKSDGVNLTIEESNTKYTGGDKNKKWAFPISEVVGIKESVTVDTFYLILAIICALLGIFVHFAVLLATVFWIFIGCSKVLVLSCRNGEKIKIRMSSNDAQSAARLREICGRQV